MRMNIDILEPLGDYLQFYDMHTQVLEAKNKILAEYPDATFKFVANPDLKTIFGARKTIGGVRIYYSPICLPKTGYLMREDYMISLL